MISDFEQEIDVSFPGENWFFYWKSSPSLWKEKLKSYKGLSPVFVPINWSYHSDTGDEYDFSDYKPETNLAKISEISNSLNIKVVFLLPLTPVPYLSNGGIPPLLARTMSINKQGIAQSYINADGRVNTLYSFFDPRVYQAFRKFIWSLYEYFKQNNISNDVFGMNCGFTQSMNFKSYLLDTSKTFEQGFEKFLKSKMEDLKQQHDIETLTPKKELILKVEYSDMILDLYAESSKETLSDQWGGVLNFSFMGGAPSDLLFRSFEFQEHPSDYFESFFMSLNSELIPSSVLLPSGLKKGIFNKVFSNHLNNSYIKTKLNEITYGDENIHEFKPLIYFYIFNLKNHNFPNSLTRWKDLNLMSLFDETFPSNYRVKNELSEDTVYNSEEESSKNYFFQGIDIEIEEFKTIIKLLMNSNTIIIDKTGLSKKVNQRIESFILENSLQSEKLNFVTQITYVKLGSGKLILFDGRNILKVPPVKRLAFFKSLIDFLKIPHVKSESDKNLYYIWEHRSPSTSELNFEEIRRVNIYNPTSYKKRIKFSHDKKFALLKVIDQYKCEVNQQPMNLSVDCLPMGNVGLEFGYFES